MCVCMPNGTCDGLCNSILRLSPFCRLCLFMKRYLAHFFFLIILAGSRSMIHGFSTRSGSRVVDRAAGCSSALFSTGNFIQSRLFGRLFECSLLTSLGKLCRRNNFIFI